MSENVTKIEYDADPERCKGVAGGGQCINKRAQGAEYCCIHLGSNNQAGVYKQTVRNLNLTKYKAQVELKANNPNYKNLSEEVGVLRIMLETLINKCENDVDLITNSHQISDMVLKIERCVLSCQKLDGALGNLLDKKAILQFAGDVVAIIGEELTDEVVMSRIANRILERIPGGTVKHDEISQ